MRALRPDGWIVTVTYKGYAGDEEPEPAETEQWNLGFDFSEEPLESHPNLKEIKATYGGYYEEPGGPLKFPEFMPKESKGKVMTLAKWADHLGVPRTLIRNR